MKKLAVGILAHVDAGKTTLSEAMLYMSGNIKRLGRVDKGNAFLDTYELEKKRGITIFSKQAILRWREMELTLLDTPGHVDFSAETERTLQVLDYAILVISGTDGVQEHTRTLWRLLFRYRVPTFVFVNKMDLEGPGRDHILGELKEVLKENFVDFETTGTDSFYEQVALCGEDTLDSYLETGCVEDWQIREHIRERRLFPCYFGSALKLEGVEEFMEGLEQFSETPQYPEEFGARVFKITRDAQGNKLTHMKITGGVLKTRDVISGDKVSQIRIYSGDKFEAVKEAMAGTVCAVLGLAGTFPGECLGGEADAEAVIPLLEPVMTYRIELPEGVDAAAALPKFRQLEEEDPQLHLIWEESKKEIHVQIMGEIQMEILKSMIAERFSMAVEFGGRSMVYKETIANTVEGVGHFEPLRHYAEVHLLLEPGEPGSGLQFASVCSEDVLAKNWQRLVLTHLAEREHKGVLTGSSITDMKITLLTGRAHVKHTEGGDFRQAVYRAVRQGLKQAESVLLEPFYHFRLEVPGASLGRAMTDVERMSGTFEPPAVDGDRTVLEGRAPASCMEGYQKEVTAYTGGAGRLSLTFAGYGPCHNADQVIAEAGYDAEADLDNPTGSVFCAHGAGFVVNWDEVPKYMHLESCLQQDGKTVAGRDAGAGLETAGLREEAWIDMEEVDSILERTFYANRKNKSGLERGYKSSRGQASEIPAVRTYEKTVPKDKYLLVDGYNIIFAWQELKELAMQTIDGARGRLLDILSNYQGIKRCELIVVFDAYRVQGHAEECVRYHNIRVVYTKEAETADRYIEKFAHINRERYDVTVATSDNLEQIIIRGQGCGLLSARDLEEEVRQAEKQLREEYEQAKLGEKNRNYLLDSVSEETKIKLKELPEN